jgi:hypothetical protein
MRRVSLSLVRLATRAQWEIYTFLHLDIHTDADIILRYSNRPVHTVQSALNRCRSIDELLVPAPEPFAATLRHSYKAI